MSNDELIQINRALLRAGARSGLVGVEELVDRLTALTARVEQLEVYPVAELDLIIREMNRTAQTVGESWELDGYQGLESKVRRLLEQWSATARENRILKRELGQKVSLAQAAEGLCDCGYRVPLVDLFGHDSIGHRLGNVLARYKIETVDQLREKTDSDLLKMRNLGVLLMRRLHERIEHCDDNKTWLMVESEGDADAPSDR